MVPICRDTGSVIAFGGRQMDADQGRPKYLNSPETPIYSKSRTLYGLNLTKGDIRKRRFRGAGRGLLRLRAGVPVAGRARRRLLRHGADAAAGAAAAPVHQSQVVLSFDPDAAGQGAAARSCELLVAEGFDVNVVVLDKGEDPDTFIRKKGADQYRERLRTSRPYLEYLLDQAAAGLDFGQDENRRQFLGKMLAVAAKIPDAAARDQFADRIAHKARITEDVVRAEIRKAAVAKRTEVTASEMPGAGQLKSSERGLIWGLFHRTAQAVRGPGGARSSDLTTWPGGRSSSWPGNCRISRPNSYPRSFCGV